MNRFTRYATATAIGLFSSVVLAAPQYLITHNLTDVESNAYVAGQASPAPTKARSTNLVSWFVVKMACYGHSTNGKCPAEIKMATNTASPILLGTVEMDTETGIITPATLSNNGYTLTVNGPGETTLSKD